LPYDADGDFMPIGRIGVSPFFLVVNSKSNINSLADLIAAAKANPGKVSYASAGTATNPHMLGEMLGLVTSASLSHIPYKGPGPAQVDLLGGNVDMQFDTPSATAQLIKSGKLKALATTGPTRYAGFPDVPTVAELGYPQLQLQGWTALYAPRAVPPAIVKKLQETLKESLKSPQVRSTLLAMGTEPDTLIGDELLQEQRKSREVWRKLATTRNISLD
jgi:tripartite-type tricarboxylate transporter receptor subunit TctC